MTFIALSPTRKRYSPPTTEHSLNKKTEQHDLLVETLASVDYLGFDLQDAKN